MKSKKWTNTPQEGAERSFSQFILDPIFKIFSAINHNRRDEISSLLEKLGVKLGNDEKDLEGKALLKLVMRKFFINELSCDVIFVRGGCSRAAVVLWWI